MKRKGLKSVCAALAAVVMVSGFWMAGDHETVDRTIPQLVSYVDSGDGSIIIEGEETPLAAKPVVKTTVSTKTSTKKVKLPAKAQKTAKSTSSKTKKTSKTKVSGKSKVKTDTTVYTKAVTSLKKNSVIKTIQTTVKTTVKTTTTALPQAATTVNSTASAKANGSVVKAVVSIRNIAPKAHANVLSAYEKMGFTVNVDSTVGYSGRFDAKTQNITVQKNSDEAIYHELGHFVAFAAGNVDQTSDFQNIFANERNQFTGTRNNDAYIKSSAAEYFAESYQDYVERPSVLKSTRPQTYNYIADAVAKVTDARAAFLCQLYASVWK